MDEDLNVICRIDWSSDEMKFEGDAQLKKNLRPKHSYWGENKGVTPADAFFYMDSDTISDS
jgi:hypothetical protein